MEWTATLLLLILWFVGVPLVVFGALKIGGYDWNKPWLRWRSEAGPLPVRVYVGVTAFIALGVLIAALTR